MQIKTNKTLKTTKQTKLSKSQTLKDIVREFHISPYNAKTQRQLYRHCRKTFTDTNKTILFSTKKSMEVWQKYIHCLVEKYSIRKTAKICGIGVNTAFFGGIKSLMNCKKD